MQHREHVFRDADMTEPVAGCKYGSPKIRTVSLCTNSFGAVSRDILNPIGGEAQRKRQVAAGQISS